MVGIIRDQTRNYQADQSGAIAQQQLAQNISEWGTVVNKVGKIWASAYADNAAADQEMIDTQIGDRLNNDLLDWNNRNVAKGVDTTTDDYTQKLYAKRDEIFQPYIDQMSTDKGRAAMQKMALDAGESIRKSNIGKIAQNRKKAQAAAAFAQTGKQLKNDAYGFGQIGDWDGFQEATKSQRDTMIKYAKKNGGDAAAAETEFNLDYNSIVNYLGGLAESDPDLVVNMLDKEGTEHEQLKGLIPDKVLERYTDDHVKKLQTQKQQLQERLKSVPAGSKAHDAIKKQIKELDDKIANPDEDAFGLIREALSGVILPEAKKNAEKAALARKQMEERYAVDTFAATISPDAQERFNARAQVEAPFSMGKFFSSLKEKSDSKEPFARLKNAYEKAKNPNSKLFKTDKEMPMNQEVKYKASQATAEALNKALAEGDTPDIERLTYGFEAIAELQKTPGMSDSDIEKVQNILHAGLYDKVFGGMASNVMQNPDKFFPDNSWLQNIFANPTPVDPFESGEYKQSARNIMGLPSNETRDTDIDTVDKYFRSNAIRITDTAINMLDKAAQLPTTELRQAAVQEVSNYVASEKEKVYNNAIKSYGIDLNVLRDQKKTTGRAFTTIGGFVYEFMGDTPEGKPIFEIPSQWGLEKEIRTRIEANMKMLDQKGEKDGRK